MMALGCLPGGRSRGREAATYYGMKKTSVEFVVFPMMTLRES